MCESSLSEAALNDSGSERVSTHYSMGGKKSFPCVFLCHNLIRQKEKNRGENCFDQNNCMLLSFGSFFFFFSFKLQNISVGEIIIVASLKKYIVIF